MKIRPIVFGGILALSCLSHSFAQDDLSQVSIKSIPVNANIYMLEGQGGNIGVSTGADGVLLIDDQFAPLSDKILNAVRDLNGGPVKFVINTHWHGDHVGGNENFGDMATVIAHQNVRRRMSRGQTIEFLKSKIEPYPPKALPVITFTQSMSVHFNGEEIKIIHFPQGHTDGDSVVFFTDSNVVHMGDHFFSGAFPFIDLESGGDLQGYANNVAVILDEIDEDTKVIPGHGTLSSKKDLKAFYDMIIETSELIQDRIDQGKNLEQIQEQGLGPKWESWGKGFISTDRWIQTVYEYFTGE